MNPSTALLNWYLSYYPLTNTNRSFVLFFRNNMGWPEKSFMDELSHIQNSAEDVRRKLMGTELMICQLAAGKVFPVAQ